MDWGQAPPYGLDRRLRSRDQRRNRRNLSAHQRRHDRRNSALSLEMGAPLSAGFPSFSAIILAVKSTQLSFVPANPARAWNSAGISVPFRRVNYQENFFRQEKCDEI